MISSWPTLLATGYSITLSPNFPPGKGKRSMCLTAPSSVGQGLPHGILIPNILLLQLLSAKQVLEGIGGPRQEARSTQAQPEHMVRLKLNEAVQNLKGACCQDSGQNKVGAIEFRALFNMCLIQPTSKYCQSLSILQTYAVASIHLPFTPFSQPMIQSRFPLSLVPATKLEFSKDRHPD